MWIGVWSYRTKDEKFHKFAGLSWTDNNLKFLGELIGEDLTNLQIVNIENTVQEMTKSLHFWKGKYLSKKGTIRVINSYVLSKMFYDTETQTPTDEQIKRIEDKINKCSASKDPAEICKIYQFTKFPQANLNKNE